MTISVFGVYAWCRLFHIQPTFQQGKTNDQQRRTYKNTDKAPGQQTAQYAKKDNRDGQATTTLADQVGLNKIVGYVDQDAPDYGKNRPTCSALITEPNSRRNSTPGPYRSASSPG